MAPDEPDSGSANRGKPPRRRSDMSAERILEAITDAVVVVDQEWRVRYVNRAAARRSRAGPAMLGRKLWDGFLERAALERALRSARLEGTAARVDEHERASNTWREHTIYPSVDGAIICSRDITARKRTEEALQSAQEQLEQRVLDRTGELSNANEQVQAAHARITEVLESITDAFTAVDREWRYTYVNDRAAQLLGRTRGELIGRSVSEVFPESVGTEAYRHWQEAMADQLPRYFQAFSAPRQRWFENYVYPTSDGLSVHWRDITERKRTEDAVRQAVERLRRSEAYLAEAQRLSHLGSWALTVATGELFWSDEHFRILGLTPQSMQPAHPSALDWIHEDDRAIVRSELDAAIHGRREWEREYRIVRPDGSIRHIRSYARPLFNGAGELTEYVGTIVDVTDRLEEERQRTELLRRLAGAQEDERRRISREMHDQFGQLSALTLKLAALKSANRDRDELYDQLEALERQARQLDEDAESIIWQLRPPALDDQGLEPALSNYASSWSEQLNLPVDVQIMGIEARHRTDEIATTLYRVMQEALNNVARHAAGATRVAIVLEGRPDHVSLMVEDDGAGFDAAGAFGPEQNRLGLLGMRERATLVGGTFDVESRPGSGTTVAVRIPTLRGDQ